MRENDRETRNRREPASEGFGAPRRRKVERDQVVDYKDAETLRKFMSERGRISAQRIIGGTTKQQRQIKKAIRRARVLGLVP